MAGRRRRVLAGIRPILAASFRSTPSTSPRASLASSAAAPSGSTSIPPSRTSSGRAPSRSAVRRTPARGSARRSSQSYCALHGSGYAHSVEAWADDRLVGGLYGVALGGVFFGESMFHRATDASKVALVALVERLRARGFGLLDTQWVTDTCVQFGAIEIPRPDYIRLLETNCGSTPALSESSRTMERMPRARSRSQRTCRRSRSVNGVGLAEGERRDLGVEAVAALRDHLVGALHDPERRRQRTAGRVLERFAGLQRRLLADDARVRGPLRRGRCRR